MHKLRLTVLAAVTAAISACSNVPDASVIEPAIVELWSECALVKVKNVKKTNGIERGSRYEMEYSFELETTKNVDYSGSGRMSEAFFAECKGALNNPMSNQFFDLLNETAFSRLGKNATKEINKGELLVKKGETYIFQNRTVNLIKSEKGWIID